MSDIITINIEPGTLYEYEYKCRMCGRGAIKSGDSIVCPIDGALTTEQYKDTDLIEAEEELEEYLNDQ